jgi:hypothetical protein
VDDRAVDLWAPLLALAMVADVEAGGDRAERLLRAARELSEPREADDESGQSGRSSGWRRKSAQSSPRPSCSRQFETADMDGSRARGVWRDSWLRSGLWLGIRTRGGRRGPFYLLDPGGPDRPRDALHPGRLKAWAQPRYQKSVTSVDKRCKRYGDGHLRNFLEAFDTLARRAL